MLRKNPTITVLICNYNYAQYIGAAIDSVLSQSTRPAQVLVVDDGSTDDSRSVISAYDQIEHIFKPNGGQTSAVRAALPHVRGDVLMLLDSDDLLYPHACATIAENWEGDLDLFQYKLAITSLSGNVLGHYPLQEFIEDAHRSYVLKYGYIPASPTSGNAFSTRHVREQYEYNLDKDRAFTDGYLIYTAALLGRVKFTNEVLGAYRVHGSNASTSAGATLRTVANQFRTDLIHRTGLAGAAQRAQLSTRVAEDYLNPYSWRGALLINKGYPKSPERVPYSLWEICRRGIAGFLSFPHLTFRQRSVNCLGMVLIAAAPSAVARRFLPQ